MAPLVPALTTDMLEPGEESWGNAFDRLRDRFPKLTSAQILEELRNAQGHAGRAAAALRNNQKEPEQKKPASFTPSTSTAPSISSFSSSHKEDAEKAPASHEPLRQEHGIEADAHNPVALTQEGARLRRELDNVWNEANAWGQIPTESTSTSRAITIRAELLRANATAAAIGNNGLRTELEASRQESGRLRQEIEEALAIGSVGTAAEREILRRDLDQALAHGGAATVAITERERLRVELLEAQSDISSLQSLQAEFGGGRAAGDVNVSIPKGDVNVSTPRVSTPRVSTPRVSTPRVSSPKGDVNVSTPNTPRVSSPKGDVNVSTPNTPRVSSPKGDVNVSTPKRGVNVSTPKGDGNVSTSKGDGNVSTPKGDGNVATPKGDVYVSTPKGDGYVSTPKKSKEAAWCHSPSPAGRDSPLHNTNDPNPIDTEEGSFSRKSSPCFGKVAEVAFMQCRDDPADDEVPRKMTPRFLLPDSPTPAPAERLAGSSNGRVEPPRSPSTATEVNEGFKATTSTARWGTKTQSTFSTSAARVKKTRSQMDRSPQPRSPQPDRSAQSNRSPIQPDRSPMRPAPVQASTSQRVPRDARDSNALYQKAASIFVPTLGKEEAPTPQMTHPFDHSPHLEWMPPRADRTPPRLERTPTRVERETNAIYQKAAAMFAANAGAREEVSMSQRAERDRDTNAMHQKAAAMFAANLLPKDEVRPAQRSARDSRDEVNAMYQKAASAMFATGSRDEAVSSQRVREVPNAIYQKAAAVFAGNTGLKAEACLSPSASRRVGGRDPNREINAMYQRAAAAYAAGTSPRDEAVPPNRTPPCSPNPCRENISELRTSHSRLPAEAW